jgi:proteasome lid subunit RPN8/RPN11
MSSLDVRAIDEKELPEKASPQVRQEFRVFLSEEAFDRAVARGATDTSREIGGVLVGELLRDAAGPYLQIDTTIDALHAEEKGAELTFTHATWGHIHDEMDKKHQGKKVVGWYHTHPGFGVFLSDRDQFIHKSFFNLPFQVALVYDPKSREHGVFTWHDNEVRRVRRYWIGAREHVWDGSRHSERAEPPKDLEDKLDARRDDKRERDGGSSEEPLLPGSLGTLAVGAALLLLIGGFLGHWLGAAAGNAAVSEAQNDLLKAKIEGSQMMVTSLQTDLVGVLRDTLGDAALHKPVGEAIAAIDDAIKAVTPAPTVAPVAGTGSGSSAGSAASPPPTNPALDKLKDARDKLAHLAEERSTETALLTQLEHATRHTGELRAELAHEVGEQRAGLGAAYAELAANVVKTDPDRARRLLVAAAHFDPGNRARYEAQLKSFDAKASLPDEGGPANGGAP